MSRGEITGLWIDLNPSRRPQSLLATADQGGTRLQAARLRALNDTLRTEVEQRKKNEIALSESERRLRSILDTSPSIVFIKDTSGRYLYVNSRFQEICNSSPASVVGKTDLEIFPPDIAETYRANDVRVLQSGVPLQFEETAVHRDGPHISLVNKFPLRDSSAKIYATCGIVTDITGRKRAEEELRASEERFRTIVESVADYGIFMIDPEGRIASWNAGAERIQGFRAEEILGHPYSRFFTPEDVAGGKPGRILSEASRTGAAEDEGWRVRKDGTRYWTHMVVTALHDRSGAVTGFVKVTRDLTERKRAEEELRDEHQRLTSLVESSPIGILFMDTDGRVETCNAAFERMFQFTAQELRGKRAPEVITGRQHRAELHDLNRRSSMGETVRLSTRRRRKDGSFIDVEIFSVPRMRNGQIQGSVRLFQDVTERNAMHRALEQNSGVLRRLAAHLIQSRDNERRRIAEELHENLNQRLAIMTTEMEVLQRDIPGLPTDVAGRLEAMRENLRGVTQDAGRIAYQLHPSMIEHLGLVDSLRALCFSIFDSNGIQWLFRHRKVDPSVSGDLALSLYRIAQEALSNVKLHSQARSVHVMISGVKGGLHLSIRDDGVGFEREAARLQTGLGIISMEERAKFLGGTLTMTSTPKAGTHVDVRVPTMARRRTAR